MIVNPREKFQILCKIIDSNQIKRATIFCKTRRGTDNLARKLRKRRYNAKPLHGGLSQSQRDRVTNSFRKRRVEFLVATDVAARGLDIQGITHIINYDIPLDALVYFHRIGRTARKGLDGTAITLVAHGQMSELKRIKALTKTDIEELDVNEGTRAHASKKMHKAVCTDCGENCEVPFKPDLHRPIYCKTCWERVRRTRKKG
jgi:ATP-dependent RNA helicase DeaD